MPTNFVPGRRVKVSAAHMPDAYGLVSEYFRNRNGFWVRVRLDGLTFSRWFWHEYVSYVEEMGAVG